MNKQLTFLMFVAVLVPHTCAAGQPSQHDSMQATESQGSAPPTKPKSQKVYQVGGNVTIPRVIRSIQPQLDEQQIKQLNAGKKVKRTGTTVLRIVVGEDGAVLSAKVLESFDHDLDAKAIDAVKQWKFDPATRKGVPVAVEITVKADFRLYK